EDRAARKLVLPVPQERPVRDLARRRAPGPDRVQQPARALRHQPVEVRRFRSLVPGSPAEHVVCPVGQAVEEEDDDGIHAARRLPRAACTRAYFRRYLTVLLRPSRYPGPACLAGTNARSM